MLLRHATDQLLSRWFPSQGNHRRIAAELANEPASPLDTEAESASVDTATLLLPRVTEHGPVGIACQHNASSLGGTFTMATARWQEGTL